MLFSASNKQGPGAKAVSWDPAHGILSFGHNEHCPVLGLDKAENYNHNQSAEEPRVKA